MSGKPIRNDTETSKPETRDALAVAHGDVHTDRCCVGLPAACSLGSSDFGSAVGRIWDLVYWLHNLVLGNWTEVHLVVTPRAKFEPSIWSETCCPPRGGCIDFRAERMGLARVGEKHECRLVFAKPFQHLTFRLGARLH